MMFCHDFEAFFCQVFVEILKLNLGQDFESEFDQDFEAEVYRDFGVEF